MPFFNANFCQFQASLGAKYCFLVTFCFINSPDMQFLPPQRTGTNKKIISLLTYSVSGKVGETNFKNRKMKVVRYMGILKSTR